MLSWVVIDRTHYRQTPPSFFTCPPSHFGCGPTPILEKIVPFFSCTYVEPILQPLCFQIHACNGGWGVPPLREKVEELTSIATFAFTSIAESIRNRVRSHPVLSMAGQGWLSNDSIQVLQIGEKSEKSPSVYPEPAEGFTLSLLKGLAQGNISLSAKFWCGRQELNLQGLSATRS
jgi:hypothetical protein